VLVVFPLVVIVLVARVFLFMLRVIGEIVGAWARADRAARENSWRGRRRFV
jgi:hypothetical protein